MFDHWVFVCLLFAKTPVYPAFSLISKRLYLRLKSSVIPQIKHNPQHLDCAFFSVYSSNIKAYAMGYGFKCLTGYQWLKVVVPFTKKSIFTPLTWYSSMYLNFFLFFSTLSIHAITTILISQTQSMFQNLMR